MVPINPEITVVALDLKKKKAMDFSQLVEILILKGS